MSEATEEQLETLRGAIEARPPYCSGICSIPSEHFKILYEKGDETLRIDLAKADEKQLQDLAAACSPASFGRDQTDVLDESYRKAGKLDATHFATNFNPDNAGLFDVIRSELLSGWDGSKGICCKLYKLNVYGKGSFFKSHKDTPRSGDMFGSLVIVYPTKHEGGELVLRHKGEEWTFDSAREVEAPEKPSIGYIAFFGDVEHEVLEVTSGSRVTLTYNLYFRMEAVPRKYIKNSSSAVMNSSSFREVFAELLDDASFLRQGGYLGFGLSHQYPFGNRFPSQDGAFLKGSDATIFGVARALSLETSLRIVYKLNDDYGGTLIVDWFVALDGECVEGDILEILEYAKRPSDIVIGRKHRYGSESESESDEPVSDDDESGDDNDKSEDDGKKPRAAHNRKPRAAVVSWVTDLTSFNHVEEEYASYGNEASVGYLYGNFCLLVRVGCPGSRTTTT